LTSFWGEPGYGTHPGRACELLAKQHPALAAAASTDTPAAAVKLSAGKLRTAQSFSLAAGDQELLDQVIDFYHTTLKSSPEALEYLERRGLGSPELIERFRLGYANRTLAYGLAPKQYKAGAEMRTALQRVGILRDSGHEHFNGSIVVPCELRVKTFAERRDLKYRLHRQGSRDGKISSPKNTGWKAR
jgi:DNA primase